MNSSRIESSTPRLVRFMRLAFPVAGSAGLVALLFYALGVENTGGLAITLTETLQASERTRIVNVRLVGRDTAGQSYVVTAHAGTHARAHVERITLNHVAADMAIGDDNDTDALWISLHAPEGVFDRTTESLALGAPLDIYSSAGYEAHGSEAQLDFKKGALSVAGPVSGRGLLGRFSAGAFDIFERGRIMRLAGDVRVVFHLPPAEAKSK